MDDAWQTVLAAVAAEFDDLPDLAHLTRLVLRLGLAALLGFLLGFEREHAGKAAGVRTHMLVAIGSAMFTLTAQLYQIAAADMSRVIQGLMAGIGFLCAGTILKRGPDSDHVRGLTTAAGLWMTAAIGMACGLGQEATALVSALFAFVVLALVPSLVDRLERTAEARDDPLSPASSEAAATAQAERRLFVRAAARSPRPASPGNWPSRRRSRLS